MKITFQIISNTVNTYKQKLKGDFNPVSRIFQVNFACFVEILSSFEI